MGGGWWMDSGGGRLEEHALYMYIACVPMWVRGGVGMGVRLASGSSLGAALRPAGTQLLRSAGATERRPWLRSSGLEGGREAAAAPAEQSPPAPESGFLPVGAWWRAAV